MYAWGEGRSERNTYRAGHGHDQSGVFQMNPGTAEVEVPAMRTSSTLPNFWNTSSKSFFEVYKRSGRVEQECCNDKRATDMGKDKIIVESRPSAEVRYDN